MAMKPVSSENVWLTWDMDKIFLLENITGKDLGTDVEVTLKWNHNNEKYIMQLWIGFVA